MKSMSFGKIIKIGLVVVIGVFAVAVVAHPAYADDVPIIGVPSTVATSSPSSVGDLASKVITFLGWVVGVSSGVGLLVGALLYIISAGDPGKTRTAKDAIVYSIVGLAVALLSYGIVTFVLSKKS